MTKPRISIIVAHAKNRVIGKSNKLLWYISDDLKRFKELTTGHPIVMGRKTFESIGRPLPGRTSVVITRDVSPKIPGVMICQSLDQAIDEARKVEMEEIFIIGGEEIYRQALPLADRLYLTKIDLEIEGDTYFPEYDKEFTKEIFSENKEGDGYKYTFLILEK